MGKQRKKRKPSQQQLKRQAAKKRRRSAPAEEEVKLLLYEYEITDEPILTPAFRRLPAPVREQISELHERAQDDPAEAVPIIEDLLDQYPDVQVLYNYLAAAYSSLREEEKARAITEKNYQLHPDYLFARCNYAQFCLRDGHLERIPEIFDGKFDLKLLYPHRKTFHISEAIGFSGIMGEYFYRIGDEQTAQIWYDMLIQLAPDHPMTRQLKRWINPSLMDKILRRS